MGKVGLFATPGPPSRSSEGLKTRRGNVLFVEGRQTSLHFQSSLEISQDLQPWKGKALLEVISDFEEFYTKPASY